MGPAPNADLGLRLFVPFIDLVFAPWPQANGRLMPWKPVSYAFRHGSVTHLFFNMFRLWMCGSELERLWTHRRYLHFLLAGLLAAAVAQPMINWLAGSRFSAVGASGGLYGLLLAFRMLFPNRVMTPLSPPIPMKAHTFVVFFGGPELMLGLAGSSRVAHRAHLGGVVGGFAMVSYWRRRPPFGGSRRRYQGVRHPLRRAHSAASRIPVLPSSRS